MIVVIDYQMGNPGSIINMIKKVGGQAKLSRDLDEIRQADKLVLAGVGAFDAGMARLNELNLVNVLEEQVLSRGIPILGICLGMQLFSLKSEEGISPGLGWINAQTIRFDFSSNHQNLKIPHMGWNQIQVCRTHPLLQSVGNEPRFYFVHSYHVVCKNQEDILAQTNHGFEFVSALARKNIMGTQFHPEKSHRFGMQLFRNFLAMN